MAVLSTVSVLFLSAGLLVGDGIEWRDYEEGLKEASKSGKPIFMEFSAEW